MIDAILDSSVLIDLLRGYPPATTWLNGQSNRFFGITRIAAMEIIYGAATGAEQQRALAFLRNFRLVTTTEADLEWGYIQLVKYRLSHNVDVLDCLIAAPCQREQLTLYTRNLKHFRPLLNTLAVAPY